MKAEFPHSAFCLLAFLRLDRQIPLGRSLNPPMSQEFRKQRHIPSASPAWSGRKCRSASALSLLPDARLAHRSAPNPAPFEERGGVRTRDSSNWTSRVSSKLYMGKKGRRETQFQSMALEPKEKLTAGTDSLSCGQVGEAADWGSPTECSPCFSAISGLYAIIIQHPRIFVKCDPGSFYSSSSTPQLKRSPKS